MYKCEREDEILTLLNETEYATVEYLARKMSISTSSIRRDLKNLEERGLVTRSYGGVKIAQASGKHIPFSLRSHENSIQKPILFFISQTLLLCSTMPYGTLFRTFQKKADIPAIFFSFISNNQTFQRYYTGSF